MTETMTETERYRKLAQDWQKLYKGSWDSRRAEIYMIENWAKLLELSLTEYPSALQDTVERIIQQMQNRVNTFREVWENDGE